MQEHVEITEVSIEQKFILRQSLELYEYDFSEFNNCDLNDFGLYGCKYFDHYWTDENRHPYFVMVNGKYAGFVLINNHFYLQKNESAKSIAEFFIMRKYRRQGIGNDVSEIHKRYLKHHERI